MISTVQFQTQNHSFLDREQRAIVRKAFRKTLSLEGFTQASEIDVLCTDDIGITLINQAHRKINEPTDVLSFPNWESPLTQCQADLESGKVFLGDIVLNIERCWKQSEEFGHSKQRELAYLTVHSVLHLLGYDHFSETERKSMRKKEETVMNALSLLREEKMNMEATND
jgi:probable rRNA maturation factor